ncbi:SBP (S-ribonuclease binding protein) family protein [Striga asiatica]|uniref:SBP (S-ribonuclease binding protein) family protein n=1 Tax=Striga asiatica TaxID=4170 RepID=A0A5A7PFR3_STRAF|nr:SBP (S-ribonuclease binding protein) family protein [Striga asiatica]
MREGLQVEIKDEAPVKLSDYNWVPDIRSRKIHLKEGVEWEDISFQELLDGNSNRWNTQRVRDLIAQEDCGLSSAFTEEEAARGSSSGKNFAATTQGSVSWWRQALCLCRIPAMAPSCAS